MSLFSIKFNGYYPVGAVAIVSADTRTEAKKLLEMELEDKGLKQDIPLKDIHHWDPNQAPVNILLDGEY